MKLQDVTVEQLNRVLESYGDSVFNEPIVSLEDARQLEYKIQGAGALAIPMRRLQATSDVIGALAFGIEIGLKIRSL